MLDNIRAHSFKVGRVAELIIDGLKKAEKTTSSLPARDFVIAGALLHDIAKTECIKTGCLHADRGDEICRDLGYPEIGEIVREHVILKEFTAKLYQQGLFGAKELVYYADKRVRHDEIVSLDSRLDYIIERYGNSDPKREHYIRLNFQQAQELEVYLFNFLDFSADQVPLLISQDPFSRA
ncbi:MAG: HD domain-containing protein [Deltaproteobacteria bacterium]|nr:HD domain-containing protein [Deltaproteobacteria bacterium]MBW2660319.1 HD domain-containing protein [Deltaproteobacteria bacterium]